MISATLFEAKTNLSELVKRARRGETVIITSGRARTPVARLEPFDAPATKRLGARKTPGFALTPAFFAPLPEAELRLWNGEENLRAPRASASRRRAK